MAHDRSVKFAIKSRSSGFFLDGRGGQSNPLLTNSDPKGNKSLQWYVIPTSDGYFALQSVSSGNYLDGRTSNCQDPLLTNSPPEGNAHLNWLVITSDYGYVALKSRSSALFLDGRNANYTNPLLSNRPDHNDQFLQWSIIPLPEKTSTSDPYIKIALLSSSSTFFLDGRGGQSNPLLTNRIPFGDNYLDWYLVPTSDGFFAIKSVSSGFYLDGRNSSTTEPFMTNRAPEGDHYLNWSIVQVDNGYYALQSRSSGLYLDGRNKVNSNPLLTNRPPKDDLYLQWSLVFIPSAANAAILDTFEDAKKLHQQLLEQMNLSSQDHQQALGQLTAAQQKGHDTLKNQDPNRNRTIDVKDVQEQNAEKSECENATIGLIATSIAFVFSLIDIPTGVGKSAVKFLLKEIEPAKYAELMEAFKKGGTIWEKAKAIGNVVWAFFKEIGTSAILKALNQYMKWYDWLFLGITIVAQLIAFFATGGLALIAEIALKLEGVVELGLAITEYIEKCKC